VETTFDQAHLNVQTIATANEAEEQRDLAVMELSNLELSLVGGGLGAVSFM
jgi:hypothetical protein